MQEIKLKPIIISKELEQRCLADQIEIMDTEDSEALKNNIKEFIDKYLRHGD